MIHNNSPPNAANVPLPQYAVSPSGRYLVHGWENRQRFQIITARGEQIPNEMCKIKLNREGGSRGVTGNDFRKFTTEELQTPERGVASKFMVVGLALTPEAMRAQGLTTEELRTSSHSSNSPIGFDEPRDPAIVLLDTKSAIPVVTPLQRGKESRVGGLLEYVDGIRSPYWIASEDVFYFSEFRDASKNKQTRAKHWPLKAYDQEHIAAQCSQADTSVDQLSDKQAGDSKTTDATAAVACYAKAIKTEASEGRGPALTTAVPAGRYTTQMARFMSALQNDNILAFFDLATPFGKEAAARMYTVLQTQWPEIKGLEARHLFVLRQGISAVGLKMAPELLYNLLAASVEVEKEDWLEGVGLLERAHSRATKYYYPGK